MSLCTLCLPLASLPLPSLLLWLWLPLELFLNPFALLLLLLSAKTTPSTAALLRCLAISINFLLGNGAGGDYLALQRRE